MGWIIGRGIGVPFRLGSSQKWSSYWLTHYVSGLTATPFDDSRIDLAWANIGTGITGHKVYVSTDNGASFSLFDTIETVETTYSAIGLTTGTFYIFYLRPYKDLNDGNASNKAYSYPLQAETTTYITGLVTPLTDPQLTNINHFIGDVKSWLAIANISDKADLAYMLCGATDESSLRNLASASFTITKQGTPTFVQYQGWLVPDTSNYLKTGWKDSTNGIKFTQNDACDIVFTYDPIENILQLLTGAVKTAGGNKFCQIYAKYVGKFGFALNDDTSIETKNFTFDRGMYAMFRDSATHVRGYINSVKKIDNDGAATTSVALNDLEDFIGCRNLDGAANAASNKRIAFKWKGASLTESEYLLLLKAFDGYMRRASASLLSYIETQNNQNLLVATDVLIQGIDFVATGDRFRIPFIIRGSGNVVICGGEGRWGTTSDFARSHIVYKRSTDNGATWGAGQVLTNNNGIFTTYDHGSRVVNSCAIKVGNRIFLFHTKIDDETATIYYGVTLEAPDFYQYFGYKYSDDDGVTWSDFVDLTSLSDSETNLLTASPSSGGIILSNGTICIPALSHRHSANTDDAGADWGIRSGIIYSTDNGETWQISNLIPSFTDECTIVEYETNKIMCICRSLADNFRVFVTDDLGATWTAHANDRLIEGTNCEITALKYKYNGITKFLLTNPLADVPSRGDIRIRISDDAISWKNMIQLWALISAGYTSHATNENGDLFSALETGINIVMWNLSSLKDDIIKDANALPYS